MALGGKRWYQMSGKITTRFQWLWSQMGPYRTDIFALAGHPSFHRWNMSVALLRLAKGAAPTGPAARGFDPPAPKKSFFVHPSPFAAPSTE